MNILKTKKTKKQKKNNIMKYKTSAEKGMDILQHVTKKNSVNILVD
jgi:hypothetical protein